jgi:hypothetical protein
VEVVIGSNSKYGEPSRSYVSVELKARGIKVTAGDEALTPSLSLVSIP